MRVLVVNAGSSSLKLRVLDEADRVTGPPTWPRRAARRMPKRWSPRSHRWVRPTRPATASCTAGRRSPPRSGSTAACWPGCGHSPTWRRCTSRSRWPRSKPSSGRCPACPVWPASTPRSMPRSRPRRHLRAAARMAPALGPAALRLPRAVPCVLLAPGGGTGRRGQRAALRRHLPPRRRCLAGRCARRRLGGHHHGLHPAGGPGDGHPVRVGRPGTGAVAGGTRRHAARGTGGHPGIPLRPARPGRDRGHARGGGPRRRG